MRQQVSDGAGNLTKWLKKLSLTFRQDLSPEAFETYRQVLAFMTISDQEMAFPEAVRRATDGFMPSPGQICVALDSLRDRFGVRPPNEHDDCPHCHGTMYRTVPAREPQTNQELGDGYMWAVRCNWKRPIGVTRERKQEFKAKECPEGRAFLAKLRSVKDAVSMPQPKTVRQLERELARQKRESA